MMGSHLRSKLAGEDEELGEGVEGPCALRCAIVLQVQPHMARHAARTECELLVGWKPASAGSDAGREKLLRRACAQLRSSSRQSYREGRGLVLGYWPTSRAAGCRTRAPVPSREPPRAAHGRTPAVRRAELKYWRLRTYLSKAADVAAERGCQQRARPPWHHALWAQGSGDSPSAVLQRVCPVP